MDIANADIPDHPRSWRFRVYLDDKAIGWHTLDFDPSTGTMKSQARYEVKLLFVTAYRYVHDASEVWQGSCLERVDAFTNANGSVSSLEGRRNVDAFVVSVRERRAQLPTCVQSFAYWDSSILHARRLLNPQTGEYLPVETLRLGPQEVRVHGRAVSAQAWRLTAKGMRIDLWYSDDNEWLGLQSSTEGGRVLRYQLE